MVDYRGSSLPDAQASSDNSLINVEQIYSKHLFIDGKIYVHRNCQDREQGFFKINQNIAIKVEYVRIVVLL